MLATSAELSEQGPVPAVTEPQELHDWFAAYVTDNPKAASRLASKMQADAVNELVRRGEL